MIQTIHTMIKKIKKWMEMMVKVDGDPNLKKMLEVKKMMMIQVGK